MHFQRAIFWTVVPQGHFVEAVEIFSVWSNAQHHFPGQHLHFCLVDSGPSHVAMEHHHCQRPELVELRHDLDS
jgi:hypothetical protein